MYCFVDQIKNVEVFLHDIKELQILTHSPQDDEIVI